MGSVKEIMRDLKSCANKEKAAFLPRFFKTGKGEYGEGDKFLGVTVPDQRKVVKKHHDTTSKETIIELLHSAYHEERLTGVLILCQKFLHDKKFAKEKQWVDLYLNYAHRINNWDLVDSSAHIILGQWLENKDRKILYRLAKDELIWKNRIAVVSTLHFIRKHDFKDILQLSEIMIKHPHDLMHKATGWMLRESWKRDAATVEAFLDQHAHQMPRTMLRYTIEKMKEPKRRSYLRMGAA